MNQNELNAGDAGQNQVKRAYMAPALVTHGALVQLTKDSQTSGTGKTSNLADGRNQKS